MTVGKMRWAAERLCATALVLALGGCGGGGSGSSAPATAPLGGVVPTAPPAAPVGSGSLSFTIAIPSSTSTSASGRVPKYVSPSTASVAIMLQGQTTPLATANLSSTSPGCSVAPGGTVCTVTFNAPAGTDTFQIATYNGTNATGQQLSVATLIESVTANASARVALALSGVVSTVAVILGSTSVPAGTPASVAVTVVAYDASGNAIVGPGSFSAPVTLANSDTSGVTTLSTTTVAGPGTSVTLNYNGNSLLGATITPSFSGTAGTAATFAPTGYAVANYNVPSSDTSEIYYDAMAAGPDGNLWYGTYGIIGKVSPQGQFTEYSYTNGFADDYIDGMAAGPDGNVWFADEYSIGKITPSGTVTLITSYATPQGPSGTACGYIYGIVKGPDGNMWFTDDCDYIGEVNPTTGNAQEFDPTTLPGFPSGGFYPAYYNDSLAFGPDGKLYVADWDQYAIDQFTIAGGAPTAATTVELLSACDPYAVVAGPDGNMWFSDDCENLGMVPSAAGFSSANMAMWSVEGLTSDEYLYSLASSPGGIWATDKESNTVYRITGLTALVNGYPSPLPSTPPISSSTPPTVVPVQAFAYAYAEPFAIALGPDGNIWTAEYDEEPIALAKIVYGAAGTGALSVARSGQSALRGAMRVTAGSALKLGRFSRIRHTPGQARPQLKTHRRGQ